MPVITGKATYPSEVLDALVRDGVCIDSLDALSIAEQAGSSKAVNIVLMSRLAKYLDISYDKWIDAIKSTVNAKFIELNLKAFETGYNL